MHHNPVDADAGTKLADLTDDELVAELSRREIVSSAHLKAALEYCDANGGRLASVLKRLGLLQESELETLVDALSHTGTSTAEIASDAPPDVDVSKLRVYFRLLDKVPETLAEEHGVLLFLAQGDTRGVLMTAERSLSPEQIDDLGRLLGVRIVPIELSDEERVSFREELHRRRGCRAPTGDTQRPAEQTPKARDPGSFRDLLGLIISRLESADQERRS